MAVLYFLIHSIQSALARLFPPRPRASTFGNAKDGGNEPLQADPAVLAFVWFKGAEGIKLDSQQFEVLTRIDG